MIIIALRLLCSFLALASLFHFAPVLRWGARALPPGNSGLPLLGELGSFLYDYEGFMIRMRKSEDDRRRPRRPIKFWRSHLLFTNFAICWDPGFPHVLQEMERRREVKVTLPEFHHRLLGPSSAADSELVFDIHRTISQALGTKDVGPMLEPLMDTISQFLEQWADAHENLTASSALSDFSLALILRVLIGRIISPERSEEYRKATKSFIAAFTSLPVEVPGSSFTAGLQARSKLRSLLEEDIRDDPSTVVISLRLRMPKCIDEDDALDMVLKILAYALIMLPSVLSGLLKFCSEDPSNYTKARAEVTRCSVDSDIEYHTLSRGMPNLDALIVEILRMTPPIPFVAREVQKDLNLGGYVIPRKWMIGYNLFLSGRDPDRWPRPDKFDPDRFETESMGTKVSIISGSDQDRVSVARNSRIGEAGFCPFGFGRSQCPSQNFSLAIIKLFAVLLLSKYQVKTTNSRLSSPNGISVQWELEFEIKRLSESSKAKEPTSPKRYERARSTVGERGRSLRKLETIRESDDWKLTSWDSSEDTNESAATLLDDGS